MNGVNIVSKDWFQDMLSFDKHYNFDVSEFEAEKLKLLLQFRLDFLKEELKELEDNMNNPEEIVDALIDLIVVATGTLTMFKVDGHKAWQEVYNANMNKQVGIKKERYNPFGLPDLIKPADWATPSHKGNHGLLEKIK